MHRKIRSGTGITITMVRQKSLSQ